MRHLKYSLADINNQTQVVTILRSTNQPHKENSEHCQFPRAGIITLTCKLMPALALQVPGAECHFNSLCECYFLQKTKILPSSSLGGLNPTTTSFQSSDVYSCPALVLAKRDKLSLRGVWCHEGRRGQSIEPLLISRGLCPVNLNHFP